MQTSETKLELIKSKPKYILLAHGSYSNPPPVFTVPPKTVIIFLSKASRGLAQSIVTEQFYNFFGRSNRNYSQLNSSNMPDIVKGWNTHTYGPGQQISDINLSFRDPLWPGMGIHTLPISLNQFKINSGQFAGQEGALSTLPFPPSGSVLFVVACRGLSGQASHMNQTRTRNTFANNMSRLLINQNNISKNLSKRKISSNNNRAVPMNIDPNNKRRINIASTSLNENKLMQNSVNINNSIHSLINRNRKIVSAVTEYYYQGTEPNRKKMVQNAYFNFKTTQKRNGRHILSFKGFMNRLMRLADN